MLGQHLSAAEGAVRVIAFEDAKLYITLINASALNVLRSYGAAAMRNAHHEADKTKARSKQWK